MKKFVWSRSPGTDSVSRSKSRISVYIRSRFLLLLFFALLGLVAPRAFRIIRDPLHLLLLQGSRPCHAKHRRRRGIAPPTAR